MLQVKADGIRRWSTADVPQARRLDYFAAALSEAIYPIRIDEVDPRTFHAEVSVAHVDAIRVCKMIGSPHAAFRGWSELTRTGNHGFNLQMTLQSSWTANHRGASKLAPRDILIIDSEYPLKTAIDAPFSAISVAVSENWLRQWLPNPKLLTARRIPGNSLWGHALSSYVSELSPELAAAPLLPLSVIADQVGSLLALTADGLKASSVTNTLATRSLLERALECLSQRCAEWQLTAADIASSVNVSLRTLHRAFAAANQTFGQALINARVRIALRMLASPSFNRLTTAEIGRRAGFPSASHFARVIRHRTGRTPLQLRKGVHPDAVARESLEVA